MRSCRDLGDLKGCKETFKLYGTQVSNGEKPLQDGSDKNWYVICRICCSRFCFFLVSELLLFRELINVIAGDPHSGNDAQSPASSVVRSFPVTKDAVYFAFRVEGACISLLSVQVRKILSYLSFLLLYVFTLFYRLLRALHSILFKLYF